MQDQLRAVLEKRVKRSIGFILGVAEQECFRSLDTRQRRELRKAVMDTLHDLESFVHDLIDTVDIDDGVVVNELYLQKIDEIHDALLGGPSRPAQMLVGAANGHEHRTPSEFGGGRPHTTP